MKNLHRLLVTVCVAALGPGAHAQVITFTNVIDTSGGQFSNFGHFVIGDQGGPALNNTGAVAFWAVTTAGPTGIYTKNGAVVTTIADTATVINGGTIATFDNGSRTGHPSINAAGRVAFQAALTGGTVSVGIFSGTGGTPTTIADTSTLIPGTATPFANFGQRPSINSPAGSVAFVGNGGGAIGGTIGVYTGAGGALTTVASSLTNAYGNINITGNGATSINGSGTVAMHGNTGSGSNFTDGILRGSSPPLTVIASNASGSQFSSFASQGASSSPSMNALGNLVFVAQLSAGGDGVFRSNGGAPTTVADSSGPFSDFGPDPSINALGMIIFSASLDAGGSGLFTGPDPVANKVIKVGDALFGSTVTGLDMSSFALNDSNQAAFFYDLADGRNGIAIATISVPEPSSLIFAGAAGAAALWRRRRSNRASPESQSR